MTCRHTSSQVSELTFWDGIRKADPNILTVKVRSVMYNPSLIRQRIWRTHADSLCFEGIQLSPGSLNFFVLEKREPKNFDHVETTLERLLTYSYRGILQYLWPDEPKRFYGANTNGRYLCVVLHEPKGGYRIFRDAYIASFTKTGSEALDSEQYEIGVEFTDDPELQADAPWLVGVSKGD